MRSWDTIVLLVVIMVTVVVVGITTIQVSSLTHRMLRIEHTLMLDR